MLTGLGSPVARPAMRSHRGLLWGALGVGGALAASAAVGCFVGSEELLNPQVSVPETGFEVAEVSDRAVTLVGSHGAARPGMFGLWWDGGDAVVDGVLWRDGDRTSRRLVAGAPEPGVRAWLDPAVWRGDPGTALGLAFSNVSIPGDLGDLPSWLVPGPRADHWIIAVHGHDASRLRCLRSLKRLHDLGFPVLVPAWRNDGDAPASPDGRYHLGDTEWHDLEAAARWAVDHGAQRLLLYGRSMGAMIVGTFLRRSSLAGRVDGTILDAPVLDWRPVLRNVVRSRHLPGAFAALTGRVAESRVNVKLAELSLLQGTDPFTRPTLLFHGDTDETVPVGTSRALANARSATVELVVVPGAGHEQSWNVDPTRYDDRLAAFLARFS